MKYSTDQHELFDLLTDRERTLLSSTTDARERINQAVNDTRQAELELHELRRRQEHEMRVLRAQWEKKAREVHLRCRQEVANALKERTQAEEAASHAEQLRRRSEATAAQLTVQLKELQAQLQHFQVDRDSNMHSLSSMMDARVRKIENQLEERIEKMSTFDKSVCAASDAAINLTTQRLTEQCVRIGLRSEQRQRFKELCAVKSAREHYNMSKAGCKALKDDIVTFWQRQQTKPVAEARGRRLSLSGQQGVPGLPPAAILAGMQPPLGVCDKNRFQDTISTAASEGNRFQSASPQSFPTSRTSPTSPMTAWSCS
eukprot:TRINITY_DN34757_c0_g1_i1.p1 TRINITY_DN34757_c0_g1~~TRINITY_DN34757_c0_g1_i1.p1  ORF type:complete len:315 (-),score=92.96 TRINITY_DN34757_c0_g1_i1:137-1081(-)